MEKSALRIGLPRAGETLHAALLGALVASESPYRPLLTSHTGAGLALELANGGTPATLSCGSDSAPMRITPTLSLEPAADTALLDFLCARQTRVNHLGINLAADAVTRPAWNDFIAAVAAALPSYQLELGGANDVVRVLGGDTVVELVYDRSGARPSLHICVEVAASRAELERAFPSPAGGYKPGDEAFFYSVGLPLGAALACYVDFAFAAAPAIDWQAIVTAAGRRLA